jgi:predicted amidohydrolase
MDIPATVKNKALENQVFVAEGNQAGALSVPVDQPFNAFGFSAILAPIDEQTGLNNGVVVEAVAGDRELIVSGEVDLEVLARSRESSEATILKDRRPETYRTYYRLL